MILAEGKSPANGEDKVPPSQDVFLYSIKGLCFYIKDIQMKHIQSHGEQSEMNKRWIARWIARGTASALVLSTLAIPAAANATSLTQVFPALRGIALTSVQQTQLEQLSAQALPQVQQLLTPEQQTQFNAALAQGQGARAAALGLNLSGPQRLRLVSLLQPLRSRLAEILTPAQQEQVQRNVQAMQQSGR